EATDPNNSITGYNYALDHVAAEANVPAATEPTQTSNTSYDYGTESTQYAEGTWYFHVRAENNVSLWSDPNNPGYQVTIDRTAPTVPSNVTSNEPTTTP